MYGSHADDIPLINTKVAYSSVPGNEADNDPWRQDADVLTSKTRVLRSKQGWQMVGWPVGALGAAIMASLALLLNISVLAWSLRMFKFHHGVAEVVAGDCHNVEKINTWVHLAINAVSTVLLSGSNYCMQILCAPTRKEIDRAHGKKKWLDIGVPSVRNLSNIARKKAVMWWLLGLSSVPLHLMYNSVFFSTIATNEYDIVFATEAFVQGGPGGSYNETKYRDLEKTQALAKTWERLENADCIDAYATEFLNTRRNLVAVVVDKDSAPNSSVKRVVPYFYQFSADVPDAFNPYAWICDAPDGLVRYGYTEEEDSQYYRCSTKLSKVRTNAARWNSNGWDIDYCLSERVEGRCSLSFSLPIIVVVMICNIGKALIMIFTAFGVKDKPLITIGDAVDSFLNANDPNTKGMCLMDKQRITSGGKTFGGKTSGGIMDNYAATVTPARKVKQSRNWEAAPIEYRPSVKRWASATGQGRWWTCMSIYFCCMSAVGGLLGYGIVTANYNNGIGVSLKGFIDLGLGAVHPITLISGWTLPSTGGSTVIASVLIANSPQPILSFVYLLFNSVFTGMLLGDEWSHFAHERKSLRVSDPKPGQRSTYFLQLPYRYAIPLLILSGVLHWSVSQSLFIAQVASFDKNGEVVDPAIISTCGFSPIAIMLTMLVGAILAAFLAVLGFRRYRPGIQLAGSCSAVISAACHGKSDIDTTAPLQWGVTSEDSAEIGHCTFSDGSVGNPREGALYAGHLKGAGDVYRPGGHT